MSAQDFRVIASIHVLSNIAIQFLAYHEVEFQELDEETTMAFVVDVAKSLISVT